MSDLRQAPVREVDVVGDAHQDKVGSILSPVEELIQHFLALARPMELVNLVHNQHTSGLRRLPMPLVSREHRIQFVLRLGWDAILVAAAVPRYA